MVLDFLLQLFNTEGFPPRWLCGTGWLPFTGWFMIVSDLMIFGAYSSIPLLLLYFVNKRKDMVFPKIFWLFAAFIFACGVSHLLDAMMFWWPAYRLNALEKFATGLISWTTVAALIPIVPQALALKSPAELEKEIAERRAAEDKLKSLNENLERIVAERTQELSEKAWQLETVNKELEAFSYTVSHDLKAPVRKIEQFNGLIQAQYAEQVNDEMKEYLGRISANTNQMITLIDDLLTFSRVTNSALNREQLDLSRIARQIGDGLREHEPERKIEITIQDGLNAVGDPSLLQAVLQNLLENAVKYTSLKEHAKIEFGEMDQNGKRVYFVRDNGVGFDMKDARRLFKPFQRLHDVSIFPGTGIGLANIQRIISRHGGRVWAEGTPDEGATFYFTLPEFRGIPDESGTMRFISPSSSLKAPYI